MATATLVRNPLATRSHTTQQTNTPGALWQTSRKVTSAKRAHSPEPPVDTQGNSSKRAKAVPDASAIAAQDRKTRRAEREQEFRDKYSRSFPQWTFFFDPDFVAPNVKDALSKRLVNMGGNVEDFFSTNITHFITQESVEKPGNKENALKARGGQGGGGQGLDSPIRLRSRATNNGPSDLLQRAIGFDKKIWSADKLESVLDRSEPINRSTQLVASATAQPPRESATALQVLLKAEKLTGTTERDPTQKRHDYVYFEKNSYFVLVEDMKQELATIVALQYPVKSRDGKEKITYPILHCHPQARGPFAPYDEKEEKRRERHERAELERQHDLRRRKLRLLDYSREQRKKAEEEEARRQGELRRTQSLSNLRRRATFHGHGTTEAFADLDAEYADGDGETLESAAASGYLASNAYIAASGNSVSITSTTGTTSNAGLTLRTSLPASLREKIQHEIVTSRKLPGAQQAHKSLRDTTMGPPPLPDRQRMLRKSRSTNTIRLPKRDEDSKPGYCESCRQKFADFKEHIYGKKHRKFAMDDANFASLDMVLSRVKRRTLREREENDSFFGSSQPREEGAEVFAEHDSSMEFPAITDTSLDEDWDTEI